MICKYVFSSEKKFPEDNASLSKSCILYSTFFDLTFRQLSIGCVQVTSSNCGMCKQWCFYCVRDCVILG